MAVLAKRSAPTRVLGTLGYLVVFVFLLTMSSLPAGLVSMVLFGSLDATPDLAMLLLVFAFWALGLKLLWPEFAARSFSQVLLERETLVVHRWGHVYRWPLSTLKSFDATGLGYRAVNASGQGVQLNELDSAHGSLLSLLATSAIADTFHRRLEAGETLTFRQPAVHLLGQETPGVLTLTLLAAAGLVAAGFPPVAFLWLLFLLVGFVIWRYRNRGALVLCNDGFRGSEESNFSPWILVEDVRTEGRQLIVVRRDRDLTLIGGGELEALSLLLIRRVRAAPLSEQGATDGTPAQSGFLAADPD